MNWTRAYEIATAGAQLAGLLAFVSFAITIYKDYSLNRETSDRERQATAIYSLLLENQENGLSIDEIAEGIGSKEVTGGVIELVSKNAVILGSDGRYRLPVISAFDLKDEAIARTVRAYQDEIIKRIAEEPGSLSASDVFEELDAKNVDVLTANRVVTGLLAGGAGPPPLVIESSRPSRLVADETLWLNGPMGAY